jgi:hypothetical protein
MCFLKPFNNLIDSKAEGIDLTAWKMKEASVEFNTFER